MSTQTLVTTNDQTLSEYGWTRSQLEIVKNLYCKGCKDEEVKVFAHICKHTQLDPFLKQIYAIPRGGKMTVQTSIDGYRLLAERTGKYCPGRETTFVEKDGQIISATAYVKKLTSDGTWHEIAATAYFSEFCGDNLWKKMPHVMIAKVAEAQALRRAFPAELSSVYTKEELDQEERVQLIPAERIPQRPAFEEPKISDEDCLNLIKKLSLTSDEYQKNFPMNISKFYGISDYSMLKQDQFKKLMRSIEMNISTTQPSEELVNV